MESAGSKNRLLFTVARLEKLACPRGKERAFFYDEKVPGLAVAVMATGAKSFYLYRRIAGRPERIKLGGFPDINVDTARELATKANGKIASGENPADGRRQRRASMTLAELFEHYLESHAKAHKRRWEDDQKTFERYFGKAPERQQPEDEPAPFAGWRNRQLFTIDTDAVKGLHVKIGTQHGHYAANRVLALLSAMYNNALLANPTKGIKKFREEQRERFLDSDELARFRQALDAHPDQSMADYFRLLLFTAARRSNVAAMRWTDVNFSRREWVVPGEKTKNGDPLVISLTDQAMAVLQRRWADRKADAEFVFPSYGKAGHITEPKAAWAAILAAAKIENFRLHDLRHTAASYAAIGGASLLVIGKMLGHKSHQSTARYAHVNRTAAAAAAQAATSAMAALMDGPATPANSVSTTASNAG